MRSACAESSSFAVNFARPRPRSIRLGESSGIQRLPSPTPSLGSGSSSERSSSCSTTAPRSEQVVPSNRSPRVLKKHNKTNRLSELRLARGLTILQLAQRVGISWGHITWVENSGRRVLTIEGDDWTPAVKKLCDFYFVDPSDVFPVEAVTLADRLADDQRGAEVLHQLCQDEVLDPEQAVILKQQVELAVESLGALPQHHRRMVLGRFDGELLVDLGDEAGVSRERVRQVEGESIARLRKRFDLLTTAQSQPVQAVPVAPKLDVEELRQFAINLSRRKLAAKRRRVRAECRPVKKAGRPGPKIDPKSMRQVLIALMRESSRTMFSSEVAAEMAARGFGELRQRRQVPLRLSQLANDGLLTKTMITPSRAAYRWRNSR